MKKHLLLAAMALSACCASVSAETLVTNDNIGDQIKVGAVITLQCGDNNGGLNYYFNGPAVKSPTLKYANLYELEAGASDDTYRMKRLIDNKYVGISGSNQTAVDAASDAVSFTINIPANENNNYAAWDTKPEENQAGVNTVRFTVSGTANFLNTQGVNARPIYAGGKGGYSFWYVKTYSAEEVAELAAVVDVTFTFPAIGNSTVVVREVSQGTDASSIIPERDFFTPSGLAESNTSITPANNTFTVEGTFNLPIEFEKVYRIKNKENANDSKYLFYDGTNVLCHNGTDENAMTGARLWYFKNAGFANGYQKVTLHTLATVDGSGVYLSSTNNNTRVTVTLAPTEFYVVSNTSEGGEFSLEHPSNSVCHLNNHGNSGYLSTWTDGSSKNNDGSGFAVSALTEEDFTDMSAPQLSFSGLAPWTAAAEDVAKLNANAPLSDFIKVFSPNPTVSNLTTGDYFTIKFKRSGKYVYVSGHADADGNIGDDDAARKVNKTDRATFSPVQMWTFTPSSIEGAMQIKSLAANGYYIGQNGNQQNNVVVTAASQWGGNFKPVVNGSDTWGFQIIQNGNLINSYLHDWGGSTGSEVGTWAGINDEGNALWVERVTEYPYTMPENGEYGALCLPFSVSLPEGVSAYYATATEKSNDNVTLHLTEIHNVIPANTPVFIKSEASTVSFPIVNEEAAVIENNILTGVIFRRTGLAADSYYTLSHNEGVSKLAKNGEATEIPSGSAVLYISNLSDSSHAADEITFVIDEPQTVIPGMFYRLRSHYGNYLVATDDEENLIVYGNESNPDNHFSIVSFVPTEEEGVYNIANQGYYLGKLGAVNESLAQVKNVNEAGKYTVTAKPNAANKFFIQDIEQTLMHETESYGLMNCLHANTSANEGIHGAIIPQVTAWDGSVWSLEPVNEVRVALNHTDGDYNVGLACFPFPVTISNDGSKLYYIYEATSANSNEPVVSYSEVNNVPAGTAFMIRNQEATTATIAIDYAGVMATAEVPNAISGTYRSMSAEAGDYLLEASDNGLGFVKKAEAPVVTANNAYLPASALKASTRSVDVLPLADPDTTTAISEIEAADAAATEVYDLQGRRVSKVGRGIFIVNGKKVLVK